MALATRSAHHTQEQNNILHALKPSRLLNTVLLSTLTAATGTLAALGSSSSSSSQGDGGRWRARDHLRHLWGLRVVVDWCFPSLSGGSLPTSNGAPRREDMVEQYLPRLGSAAAVVSGGLGGGAASARAVGRALSHVLTLINEIPPTSSKYEFALSMADRILDENADDGQVTLAEINQSALSAAFSRTAGLLLRRLQGSHASDTAAATWPSRALRLLPLGSQLASCYDGFCAALITPVNTARAASARGAAAAGQGRHGEQLGRSECVEAEKLARELLWVTNKMRTCSCVDEAGLQWIFAGGLASLAQTAHPRVQGPVVKISAILLRELAELEWEAPREVRFRMLALWLPILCHAGRGPTAPVLTAQEKREVETALADLVGGLPYGDQEVILASWLEDFTSSDSDWADLRECYDRWCSSARKLLL